MQKTNPILNKLKSSAATTIDLRYQEQIRLFPSTVNNKLISKDEFSLIDPLDMEIYVVRPVKKIVSVLSHVEYLIEVKIKDILRYKIQKRFRDFESLDIALKQKFQNLKFPEIPSKTQILKKEQTRMKYYKDLFYHFKKYALDYPNMRERLLKVVYILLINESTPIKICTHEKLELSNLLRDKDGHTASQITQQSTNQRYDSSMLGSGRSDSKMENSSSHIISLGNNSDNDEQENEQKMKDFEVFLGYMEDNTIIADRNRFGATEVTERPSKAKIEDERLNNNQQRRQTRRGSINHEQIDKVKDIDLLDKSKTVRELDLNPGVYYKMHQHMKQLSNKDVHIGYCWVKFPLSNQWLRLFAKVQDSCIKFFKDVQINEFISSYVIYNCLIETIKINIPDWDNKTHQAMIIRHEYDSDWLLVAVEDDKQIAEKRKELLAKSLEHSKVTMDVINETNRYAFGKIKIKVKQICDCPNIGKLFVRLKLGPFILETRRVKAPCQNNYKFSQDFFIPITNRFDQIHIQLLSYVTSGLFQGNHKETVIREFCIPLPFLKEEQFNDKISYPIHTDDIKKQKLVEQIVQSASENTFLNMLGVHTNNDAKNGVVTPKFELQIIDLSQFTTMIKFNPNRDVVENRAKKKEYPRKQINLVIAKFMLSFYKLVDIENSEKLVFFFKYPNLSKFLRVCIVLFIIYFDPTYLLSYLLGLVIILFILQNESWNAYTQPMLDYLFFNQRNTYLNDEMASKIITFKQDSIKKNMRTMLLNSQQNDEEPEKAKKKKRKYFQLNQPLLNNWAAEDDQAANEDQDDLGVDEKYERRQYGILEKYRDLKDKLAVLVFFFDIITDFIEKFYTLLTWSDQKASKLFLIILIIIFFVVSFLPLRYFIVLGILKKFNRGSSYYKRRYTGNKEATKIEMRNFMLTFGHLKYEDLKKYGECHWMNKAWPNKRGFEKSLINYMQEKLFIIIPKGFQNEFKTPAELIECAGYIDQVLVLRPRDENEWELRNNKNLYRKSPNPLVYLYNYIMNNISSMIYLQQNKKYLKMEACC